MLPISYPPSSRIPLSPSLLILNIKICAYSQSLAINSICRILGATTSSVKLLRKRWKSTHMEAAEAENRAYKLKED
jgi:hypothetical protein